MKRRNVMPILVLLLAGALAASAANPNLGTWKLNEAKSKLTQGFPKNLTVVYAAEGDKIKATVDGVDGQGKPTHNEWIGKFDGKDYPVTGDPSSDTRSIKQVDDRTLELTVKKDGKVTIKGKIVIAADGKSRTLTASGTDAAGKKIESASFYDKQ
jgi:phage gp45-like